MEEEPVVEEVEVKTEVENTLPLEWREWKAEKMGLNDMSYKEYWEEYNSYPSVNLYGQYPFGKNNPNYYIVYNDDNKSKFSIDLLIGTEVNCVDIKDFEVYFEGDGFKLLNTRPISGSFSIILERIEPLRYSAHIESGDYNLLTSGSTCVFRFYFEGEDIDIEDIGVYYSFTGVQIHEWRI